MANDLGADPRPHGVSDRVIKQVIRLADEQNLQGDVAAPPVAQFGRDVVDPGCRHDGIDQGIGAEGVAVAAVDDGRRPLPAGYGGGAGRETVDRRGEPLPPFGVPQYPGHPPYLRR